MKREQNNSEREPFNIHVSIELNVVGDASATLRWRDVDHPIAFEILVFPGSLRSQSMH